MTQYGYEPLSPEDSGSTLLERLNGVVPALLTNHKGAARPAYVQPGMMWIDDSGATWLLNLFDGADDVQIAAVSPETHALVPAFVPLGRKLLAGSGVKLNGGSEASLGGDVTITVAGVPTGAVMGFDLSAPPVGWIVGDGSAINRSVYTDLDTAKYCGDALNATAPAWYRCTDPASPNTTRSTTGNYLVTRDLRGVFVRFLDGGRGVDAARALGTEQLDAVQGHRHLLTPDGLALRLLYQATTSLYPGSGGVLPITNPITTSGDPVADGTHGNPRTATETRPINVALLGCIKH